MSVRSSVPRRSSLAVAAVLVVVASSSAAAPIARPASSSSANSVTSAASASASASSSAPPPITNASCLDRCHGDKEVAREHPTDAKKASVYVDALGLSRSEHLGMVCVDCHPRSFAAYPHPQARRAYCPDCHVVNESRKDGVRFADITSEFEHSVHNQKNDSFRCVHCHDAHTFQLATTRARVFDHNKVCLRCHGSAELFRRFAKEDPPNLDLAHEWLPNRDLHWSRVRCVDCHTGYGAPAGSHLILPRAFAVKKCEACHNAHPQQLLRLYGRMRARERRELGFLNAMVVNDSYVVGATRNRTLDVWAMLIIGGTLGGVSGHGALRVLAGLVRRRRGKKRDEEKHP